ncbi:hypothetical protein UZ36_04680 [Candidatus Nitromaritima sp. SCGC AAA799-C22]|nr:hypothetical protein UZ36_04680 [Candidatus Nitromaritima sp. SCGC AAA799-C22]
MQAIFKCEKFIVGLLIGFVAVHGGSAAALTQDELLRESLREKVEAHDRLPEHFEKLHLFGDFRLRYEHTNRDNNNSVANDADSPFDTQRFRIRFRFGTKVHLESKNSI